MHCEIGGSMSDPNIARTPTPNMLGRSRIRIVEDSEGVCRVVADPEDPPLLEVVGRELAPVEEFAWPEGSE